MKLRVPKRIVQRITKATNRIRYFGRKRYCPVCQNYASAFLNFGMTRERKEAKCPFCGSLERHRLIWLFFERNTNMFMRPLKKMLHVAPEHMFVKRLSRVNTIDYVTADLEREAMVKMDVTDIQFPDHTFEIIYCSHVLEHVPDDRRAMREFSRVLRPGGWAVIQVPLHAGATFEDPTITEPHEREKAFGQKNHVRRYGEDYPERLSEVGLNVQQITAEDFLSADEREKMRIRGGDVIFQCYKAPMSQSEVRQLRSNPGFEHPRWL